jgi:hypothetical protein
MHTYVPRLPPLLIARAAAPLLTEAQRNRNINESSNFMFETDFHEIKLSARIKIQKTTLFNPIESPRAKQKRINAESQSQTLKAYAQAEKTLHEFIQNELTLRRKTPRQKKIVGTFGSSKRTW